MGKSEIWISQVVRAGRYAIFAFRVPKEKIGFRVAFNGRVEDTGKDLHFLLMTYEDYEKWSDWKAHPTVLRRDAGGKVIKDANGYPELDRVPEPLTAKIADDRASRFKETVNLDPETYALIFDNTYSTLTDKTLWLEIVEQWSIEEPTEKLPILEQLQHEVPDDIFLCLKKANECYSNAHYEQASVMFRKAVDFAIRIKLLQSGLNEKDLLDTEGNELSLSHKIALLRKDQLITQRTSKDLDQIKWFGDMGAHGQMQIAQSDIRDVVEPKVRSFLVGLNLKS